MADCVEEQLLGYLLGALEAPERESVEEQLENDPELRCQLERIRQTLRLLRTTRRDFAAPAGLAERTCRFVAAHPQPPAAPPSEASPLKRKPAAAAVAPAASISRFSWQDLAVAVGILAAATLLIIPAIEQSRFNAQVAVCRDNLQQLGLALAQYSQMHHGYFPPVPQRGRLAAAGICVPMLLYGGYLDSPQCVVCPGSPLAGNRQFRIPSLDELQAVAGQQELDRLRSLMGGSYGYPLGFVENGRYHPARNLQRPFFALVADAPSSDLPGYQSLNHGGRGQNVLFEDFHVQFLPIPRLTERADHFFLNDTGEVAAGRHRNDAVIGASAAVPVRLANPGAPLSTPSGD